MFFSRFDFDMLVPDLARAALQDCKTGDAIGLAALASRAGATTDKLRALGAALTQAGFATGTANGELRRTGRAVRLFAIDLGGTKLHAALADETGRVLDEIVEATDRRGGRAVIAQIGTLCDALRAKAGLAVADIAAAALGSPGSAHPRTGRIAMAPNIADFDAIDVGGALRARLEIPVRIENDVNMAALGEYAAGTARGASNFALVAFGTGVGLGLVLNGALVRGAAGFAGEIAHMPIGADPFDAASYRLGPLETAIGSAGLVHAARMRGLDDVENVEGLFLRARAGDTRAKSTIADAARFLFLALSAVRAIVDPELVVLAGGIGLQPEIAAQLSRIGAEHPFAPKFAVSALGPRAAIAGAASCALAEAMRAGMPV
jgi:predicted NBD/HSP70 family sugar kinase